MNTIYFFNFCNSSDLFLLLKLNKEITFMKHVNLTFILLLTLGLFIPQLKSQDLDPFTSDDMVFYGLDFSEAKFLGGSGLTSPASMQDKYMPALNELMIDERRRYDVANSYQKKNVEYYFDRVDDINANLMIDEHYVNEQIKELSDEQIAHAIKRLNDSKHSGLGLVYLIEKVNHNNNLITVRIVFFDIESSQVLLVKRASGSMRGFSIRNYYAGGIRQIISDGKKNYPHWR